MRPSFWFILIVLQLWVAAQMVFRSVNLAKVSYRLEERTAAMKAAARDRSPQTEAAVQEELRLAARHVRIKQFTNASVILGVFIALDICGVYDWRHLSGRTKMRG